MSKRTTRLLAGMEAASAASADKPPVDRKVSSAAKRIVDGYADGLEARVRELENANDTLQQVNADLTGQVSKLMAAGHDVSILRLDPSQIRTCGFNRLPGSFDPKQDKDFS